jgi:hypothetical protein
VLRKNLYLFLIIYFSSLIAGELSIVFLVIGDGLSFTFPQIRGITLLLSELTNSITSVAVVSLFLIIPSVILTLLLNLAAEIDYDWKEHKNKLVILFLLNFLFLMVLWYYLFRFLAMMNGYSTK